jgi:hypothetical protein
MKQLTTAPAFNAAAKTLDFSSISNFSPSRLLGVIDATAGQVLYNPALSGFGGTWSGSVLAVQAGVTGLSSTDNVLAFYDDGQTPALESGGNLAAAAASLTTAVTKLSSLLTALGSPFQAGGSIGNASFGATQSGAWSVAISGTPTINDSQSAPFSGAASMTVGTVYPAQRSVGVLCTIAGNVQFQFSDGSTITLPVVPGWQTFPFASTQIVPTGTTATATFYNLK